MKAIFLLTTILLSVFFLSSVPHKSTLSGEDFEFYTEHINGVNVEFNMIPIKGGEFQLGSPSHEAGRDEDEGPKKAVKIEPFWMMESEVTWNLFELFIDKNKSEQIEFSSEKDEIKVDAISRPTVPYLDPSFGMGRDGYPAVSMTQYSALKFCNWLYKVTGHFYRLPTEAEWEYACKAGTETAYYFGNNASLLNEYAWYWDNSEDSYHKVKQKKPNPWGLYDMHGNVSEWVLDQYQEDFYKTIKSGETNPWRRPTELHPRVVKGGSWYDDAEALRSANRIASKRDWQKRDPQIPKSSWWNTDASFLGFRVVRPAKELSHEEIEAFFSLVLNE